MARGLGIYLYNSDDGRSFATHIKNESAAIAAAGWAAGPPANGSLPRRFKMRHVIGVDPSGFRRSLKVAAVSADLWTGAAGTFDMRGDDGTVTTFTVTGRSGERETIGG